jgi:hypothetical protein
MQSPPIRPHVARISKFFSGCSISEYREQIWSIIPKPVKLTL